MFKTKRQISCVSTETDQLLLFALLSSESEISNQPSHFQWLDSLVCVCDLVRHPEDRFSCDQAHFEAHFLVLVTNNWIKNCHFSHTLTNQHCGILSGGLGISAVLPSLTLLVCDTRESMFSHAHTQMDQNLTQADKWYPKWS